MNLWLSHKPNLIIFDIADQTNEIYSVEKKLSILSFQTFICLICPRQQKFCCSESFFFSLFALFFVTLLQQKSSGTNLIIEFFFLSPLCCNSRAIIKIKFDLEPNFSVYIFYSIFDFLRDTWWPFFCLHRISDNLGSLEKSKIECFAWKNCVKFGKNQKWSDWEWRNIAALLFKREREKERVRKRSAKENNKKRLRYSNEGIFERRKKKKPIWIIFATAVHSN